MPTSMSVIGSFRAFTNVRHSVVVGGKPDIETEPNGANNPDLNETGYIEGQTVTVEYHWLEGSARLPTSTDG
jgi:hypothetical protein